MSIPTAEELIEKALAAGRRPVAIQAMWDGDSGGWMLDIEAIFPAYSWTTEGDASPRHSHPQWTTQHLATLRFGSDFRLFNGEVPPWPEAIAGGQIGAEMAAKLGVPFWFPAPHQPDDDCAPWWDRDAAITCVDCGKRLRARNSAYIPNDLCMPCHNARVRREELRADKPTGGRTSFFEGDALRNRTTHWDSHLVVAFILAERGIDAPRGELIPTAEELERCRRWLEGRIEGLIAELDADPPHDVPEFARAMRQVTWRGRQLELELRFDDRARTLEAAVDDWECIQRTLSGGPSIRIVFRPTLTARTDLVLRRLVVRGGTATLAELSADVDPDVSQDEVAHSLQQLAAESLIHLDGAVASLTDFGRRS